MNDLQALQELKQSLDKKSEIETSIYKAETEKRLSDLTQTFKTQLTSNLNNIEKLIKNEMIGLKTNILQNQPYLMKRWIIILCFVVGFLISTTISLIAWWKLIEPRQMPSSWRVESYDGDRYLILKSSQIMTFKNNKENIAVKLK